MSESLPPRITTCHHALAKASSGWIFYRLNILRFEGTVPTATRMEDLPELVDAMSARLFDRRRLIMEGWGEVRSAFAGLAGALPLAGQRA